VRKPDKGEAVKPIRHLLAALAAAGSFQAAAAPADYSDMWWNPQESGWGMNVVQQGYTAFATLYVYGPEGLPTWYVASNLQAFAEDASGNPAFRGMLYKTTGPWQGGAFDPAKVGIQIVGDIVIEPRGEGRIYVEYFAEGVRVRKVVERQTFSQVDLAGNYHASFRLRQANPATGVPYGTREFAGDVLAVLDGETVFLRIEESSGRCEFRGTRTASGRFATLKGQYTCVGGEAGTFEIADFEVTQHAISGYLRTRSPSSHQYGRFAAARY
jgi:hypothetical protein